MAVHPKAGKLATDSHVNQRKRSREADTVDKAQSKKSKPDKSGLKQRWEADDWSCLSSHQQVVV